MEFITPVEFDIWQKPRKKSPLQQASQSSNNSDTVLFSSCKHIFTANRIQPIKVVHVYNSNLGWFFVFKLSK